MLSDESMRERMGKGWRGGLSEGTHCGQGSLLRNTVNIRSWLPKMAAKYGINSICDAGAGDLHWIKRMDWQVDYRGFDLFPRHPDVEKLDITVDRLPPCDAVLCRMVLNHLWGEGDDTTRIDMALDMFSRSASYLFATQFEGEVTNRTPQFQRLDLRPLLGDPIESVHDGHEPNCRLAMWEI